MNINDLNRWNKPISPVESKEKPKCSKCGMILDKVMFFSCPRQDCPTQPQITY